MSTNPFHSKELLKSASNYPIVKGDTPGHEFHGNQYVASSNQYLESRRVAEHIRGAGTNIDHRSVSVQHSHIADALRETSKSLEGKKSVVGLKTALDKAARLHDEAATMHHAAAGMENPAGTNTQRAAADASLKAEAASLKADRLNYYA